MTAGLAGIVLTAALAPALVAIGAIAAVMTRVTVAVEREDDTTQLEDEPGAGLSPPPRSTGRPEKRKPAAAVTFGRKSPRNSLRPQPSSVYIATPAKPPGPADEGMGLWLW